MLNNYFSIFEATISLVNMISLLIIVLFLEKNLRTNWILRDELNLFSILLFMSLLCLLLRELFSVIIIISSYFVGTISYQLITNTIPWIIINISCSVILLSTAMILLFKLTNISLINKSGRFIFKITNKTREGDS